MTPCRTASGVSMPRLQPEAQTAIGRNFYRPRDPQVAASFAREFPQVPLVTIDSDFGVFEAEGNEELLKRVDEINAITRSLDTAFSRGLDRVAAAQQTFAERWHLVEFEAWGAAQTALAMATPPT